MPNPPDRAKAVFLQALDRDDPAARAALVAAACGDDAVLRGRVEALLRAHDAAGSFLDRPAADGPPTDPADRTADYRPADAVGLVLGGRYKLVELIGEGGMGAVWLARQAEPVKRAVAVKLIKPGMDSKQVLARFEAERQALALMDHPNIARVLDAGAAPDGRPFFVMELVKGQPITAYCDAHKLTPRERLELFVPVCQAIQHAHQKGVIHRDVKPSNVLVALYDDRPVPKVIDFGVAKATGGALTERTIETAFGVVGTPQYMSPEQATLNNLDVDTRTDVYSLGVLLYELLTGSPPFAKADLDRKGLLEVLRVVREEEPPRPSTKLSTAAALPTVSANRRTDPKKLTGMMRNELDWIVMKALEKERGRRYETATGFAADVLRYLAGEPVLAVPPSAGYRVRKFVRRNRTALLAGGAVAASVLGGAAASVYQAVRADREARRVAAALDELRASAPAFAEQARGLAARERFDEAVEKLDYAARLRPDEADYPLAKADLFRCQFRFRDAAAAYRAALALRPDDGRAAAAAALCDGLDAAPRGPAGRPTRESLGALYDAMQREQRPAAELMPVARLLGEEKGHLVALWLDRLKDLPVSGDRPLAKRLTARDDGRLALDLAGTKVADLTPLAGAPLAALDASGCGDLSDLSPLRNLPLADLNVSRTAVSDLSPLRDVRGLERLRLARTPAADLAPLAGLRLRLLDVTACPVRDLAPLRGAPLEELHIRETRVTDLAPLVGMPLHLLDMATAPVTDFAPLERLPLAVFNPSGCQVTDLAFVRGMPLRELMLWGCPAARNYAAVTGIATLELLILPDNYPTLPAADRAAIAALRGHPRLRQLGAETMAGLDHTTTRSKDAFWREWDEEERLFGPLRASGFRFALSKFADGTYRVAVEDQPLSDLSVLKGVPVGELWLNNCKVADLAPLRGAPVRALGLRGNPVADLTPLRGMPVVELHLEETKVADLAPLAGLRLTKLYLHGCAALGDVAPLATFPALTYATVPAHAAGVEALRGRPGLRFLGYDINPTPPYLPTTTAEQFWADYDRHSWVRALRDAGFPPKRLHLRGDRTWEVALDSTKIADLSPLRGAPISALFLADTAVADLAPLKGMKLKGLHLFNTKVTDLRPLEGMPLEYLNLVSTPVSDLSPLKGLPLVSVRLNDCPRLTDLAPLAGAKRLRDLTLPPHAANYDFLRTLPALERISFHEDPKNGYRPDKTAEEFWKERDAK